MSWPGLFALLALSAFAGVLLLYRRWEPRGRGRLLLGALRWVAAVLVLLLLFDPLVPRASRGGRTRVLLDGSLSMAMPTDSGATAWRRAVAWARAERVRDVLVFGVDPSAVPVDSLGETPPGAPGSLLAPAVRVAAEEGARRLQVLSDGRIGDAAEAERLARAMGIAVDMDRLGGSRTDYAIVEMDAPGWAEAGKPLTVRLGVAASGPSEPDTTLAVVLKADGRLVARDSVHAPVEGRVAPLVLRFTPEPGGDRLVRVEAELSGGDAAPDDDRRVAYVRVTDRPAAVLVSLHPDWEPRFLAPALQRALGLPVQGFLHVGGTRYLRLGAGPAAGEAVSASVVKRAVDAADLLVLHGMDDAAPDWIREAASRARRLLVMPDTGSYRDGPVPLSAPAGGEWYLSGDVPASPVASLLTGLDVEDLPPLAGPRLLRLPGGWWTPLVLRRGRRGVDAPMMAAREVDGRRIVVATAAGTWRWAFSGGNPGTYDRVWSAMAGWLLGDQRPHDVAVRPIRRVVARGSSLRWVAPGLMADSAALVINGAMGTVVDTVVGFVNDSATIGALSPGDYMYRARALRHDSVIAAAAGPFSVASYSSDFTAPVVALRVDVEGSLTRRGRGVPLRAMVWPYVLLLVVLMAEWTLRRRWGLR